MKTKAQLLAEMRSHHSAARVIADQTEAENRDFTDDERKSVEAHLGEMRLLEKQIRDLDPEGEKQKQKERDRNIADQIAELSKGMPEGVNRGAGGGMRGSGAWSKAFFADREKFGRKDFLTPSGSVGVPSLSSTIPAAVERLETILQAFQPFTPLGSDNPNGQGGGGIEYLREVTRTHEAAAVAPGSKKPTSVYELQEIEDKAVTVAHLTEPIKRQYVEDYGNLKRYLDIVLRQGGQLALEDELVNGSGVAPHMTGMRNTAMINVLANPGGVSPILLARQAQTILELQHLGVDGMVYAVHPDTWEDMETQRTTNGDFVMNLEGSRQSSPINRSLRTLWGAPVVPCTALDENTMLLWHKSSLELFEREGWRIDWSENVTEHIDGSPVTDFERNMVRFRCEGRYALAIYRPSGIVEIEISAGS